MTRSFGTALVAAALLAGAAGDAAAHGRVRFGIGIGFGFPIYPAYPVYPAYPAYYPAYPAYPAYPPPSPPPAEPARPAPPDPIFYPRNNQSAPQLEADRQDCNRWATTQPNAVTDASVFHRATLACMEGRGYTVR